MTRRPPFEDDLPIDPDLAPDDPGEPTTGSRQARPPRGRSRARPDVLVAIAVGGSLGTLARASLGASFPTNGADFPWTTFGINVVGSFVLGLVIVLLVDRFRPPHALRPFLATGFLGGFTTFSTFTVETAQLGRHGHAPVAAAYLVASIICGLAAAWLGIVAGRKSVAVPFHGGSTR